MWKFINPALLVRAIHCDKRSLQKKIPAKYIKMYVAGVPKYGNF